MFLPGAYHIPKNQTLLLILQWSLCRYPAGLNKETHNDLMASRLTKWLSGIDGTVDRKFRSASHEAIASAGVKVWRLIISSSSSSSSSISSPSLLFD
ncbi:hypothetical protein C0J52_27957 [Blattella germanica]|nr:hypothetical protein C0J52_27957 [Blattella germanica]